jgi:quercetin 2,3-dioxygenase
MTVNRVPGVKRAFLMSAGEGERFTYGVQLATVIARNEDTGGLLEVVILSGGKGAAFPLHRHKKVHESFYVLDGQLELLIDGKRVLLSRGDYANIPPGWIHGYRMRSHRTQILSWAIESDIARMYNPSVNCGLSFSFHFLYDLRPLELGNREATCLILEEQRLRHSTGD